MGIVHGQKVGSGRRRRVAPQRDHRGRTEEEEAERKKLNLVLGLTLWETSFMHTTMPLPQGESRPRIYPEIEGGG